MDSLLKRALQRSRERWFAGAMRLFDRPGVSDEVWDELEEMLISADVGVSTTEKLIGRVKQRVADERLDGGEAVRAVLKAEMTGLLQVVPPTTPESLSVPRVTLVVGVNGSGKTTSIAKLARRAQGEGRSVLLAAADTFRAAAIDQLKRWGERLGIAVIAHQPGADPAAVVFDTMQAARSRGVEEVIIDTAGRLHTKSNLMEELKKIGRVAARDDATAPHEVILVLDATTGQNGLTQARYFTEAVGVSSIFLAKLDGTARGGIVLAVCDELKIPVRFIGVGEKMEDMLPFNAGAFMDALCS